MHIHTSSRTHTRTIVAVDTITMPLHIMIYRYLIPLSIALVSYIMRVVADSTCSSWSTVCRKSSDVLQHLYAVVICFMIILGFTKAQQLRELWKRISTAISILMDGGKTKKD